MWLFGTRFAAFIVSFIVSSFGAKEKEFTNAAMWV